MRVRSFFLLCMVGAASAGLLFAGNAVMTALTANSEAQAARVELLAFRDVLRVAELINAERVIVVAQLADANPSGPAARQALGSARDAANAAIGKALASLEPTSDSARRIATLAAIRGPIDGMRATIDRLTGVPRIERPTSFLDVLQPAMQAYLDTSRLLTTMQTTGTLQDSSIQDSLDLTRMAYSLRQWVAQRGTALINVIVTQQPITPAALEDLARSVGHIDEVWAQILTMRDTRTLAPGIIAAIGVIQSRYFETNGAIYDRVIAAGRIGASYVPLADFRRDHAPGNASPFVLRDAAIDDAIARAEGLAKGAMSSLWQAIVLLTAVVAVVAGSTWWFTRRVVAPLRQLTTAVIALAARDHAVGIPYQGRRDEVGCMAQALQALRQDAIDFERLTRQSSAEQSANLERAQRVGALCEAFHEDTRVTIDAALTSASSMRSGVATSTSLVAEVETRTTDVAAANSQTLAEVRAIVGASDKLTGAIGSLAEQVGISASIAGDAKRAVVQATARMTELSEATAKIGEVTSLIQQISAQTNLLALNATIEAARAGDAGKGFAIVAGEVKTLANRTAQATHDITSQIALVKTAADGVGCVIDEIAETVSEINRLGERVAEAVEGQRRETGAIGGHVEQAVGGMDAVASTVSTMQVVASQTGKAANDMAHSVERLTEDAEQLTRQISTFIGRVRAA